MTRPAVPTLRVPPALWRLLPCAAGLALLLSCSGNDDSCYSPTRNLDTAYEADATGCECDANVDEDVCVSNPESASGRVGLICEDRRWQAVADGPCGLPAPVCTPTVELCNGKDDDCDGQIDDGFDLATDTANCGVCDHACASTQQCVAGACTSSQELTCDDGADEDADGQTDCADPDCVGLSCGAGCVCGQSAPSETNCGDGVDNDLDGDTDCPDPDCEGVSCGDACICTGGTPGPG